MTQSEQVVLRCYGRYRAGWWYLYCVDLALATRRHSLKEAQDALQEDILGYLHAVRPSDIRDAFRRPPLRAIIEYHAIWLVAQVMHATNSLLAFDWRYTRSGLRPAKA